MAISARVRRRNNQRRYQEEGTRRHVPESRRQVGPQPRTRQRPRLPLRRRRSRCSLRHLRPARQRRHRLRRPNRRHPGVRRRLHREVVAQKRYGPSRSWAADRHMPGLRRHKRLRPRGPAAPSRGATTRARTAGARAPRPEDLRDRRQATDAQMRELRIRNSDLRATPSNPCNKKRNLFLRRPFPGLENPTANVGALASTGASKNTESTVNMHGVRRLRERRVPSGSETRQGETEREKGRLPKMVLGGGPDMPGPAQAPGPVTGSAARARRQRKTGPTR